MQIDWFTFVAQIINFLILIALLKRFLYGPIQKAITNREAEIASRFEQAQKEQAAAEAARQGYDSQAEELATARQKLLAEAAAEAARWKEKHLTEAKSEVDRSRADWFNAVDRERQQIREVLLTEYRRQAVRLAEGILSCLADADGQQLFVDAFVRRVRETQARPEVSGHQGDDTGSVVVCSAFELTLPQQSALLDALVSVGHSAESIQFRADPSLICGLKVRTSGYEISWDAHESLEFLANEFSRELNELLRLPDGVTAQPADDSVSAETSHAQ